MTTMEAREPVVYVLQISDDFDNPVAFASEVHAKDGAALAAHDRGVTLDPWVSADDDSFIRATSPLPVFTIYRCPVEEGPGGQLTGTS